MNAQGRTSRMQLAPALRAGVAMVLYSGGAMLAIPAGALAQESRNMDAVVIEEVMVTAERRTQNLQDVPIAATVVTAEDMVRKGIDDVLDLQQAAPSIAVSTVNRSTLINIRGVGLAQTAPTSVPGVAFYIDGQLIPHEQFIRQSFYDLETIEVLRGPQGTLTGQNSTGGALYVTTPAPVFNEYSGYVDQTAGDYNWLKSVAALNLGFSDNVAVRIAGIHDEIDSFTDNIGPSPTDPGSSELDAFRATVAIKGFEDKLTVNLRGDYFDLQSGNSAIKNRTDQVTSDPFTIEEDALSYLDQQGYRASAEVRYDFGLMALRMQGSYQDGKVRDQVDGDRTATAAPRPPAANVGRVTYSGTDYLTRIYEVNLLSSGDSKTQWVVGGFYSEESSPVFVLRDNNNVVDFVASTSTTLTDADTTSASVFGQVSFYVTDKLELLTGARYTEDEQDYSRFVVSNVVTPAAQVVGTQQSDEVTGKVSANYHASEDLLAYVSASKGYKAGGVNLSPNTPNFDPERNYVYEVGVKQTVLDSRLRVNAAAFYSDYQNIQFSSLQGTTPVQQNAGDAEIFGGEVEMLGQFGGLGLNLGVSYLDATFAQTFCINDPFRPAGTGGICTAGNSIVPEGSTVPFAPEFTVNAGIEYEIPLGSTMKLTPRVQLTHIDDQLATPFPQVFTIIPSRDVVDARVTLRWNEHLQIEAFAYNLTDETYVAAQVSDSSGALGGTVYGAPLQYGGRVIARF